MSLTAGQIGNLFMVYISTKTGYIITLVIFENVTYYMFFVSIIFTFQDNTEHQPCRSRVYN